VTDRPKLLSRVRRSLGQILTAAAFLALAATGAGAQDAPKLTASAILQQTSDLLDATQSFTFHANKLFDMPLAKGGKIQIGGEMDVAVRRPNRFYVSYGDDLTALEMWYDGEAFSIQNHSKNVHSSIPAGATIGETADILQQKYDLILPLAELISESAYRDESAAASERAYLGTRVLGETTAHHIFVRGPRVDWQIWIDAEGAPLPLKLVVVRKDDPELLQQTILFSDWDLKADLPDETFVAEFEPDSVRAEFIVSKREQ
jgi:hypothetical protein